MIPSATLQEKKALLGRPGNNLKIGIVGLFPSVPSKLCVTHRIDVPPTGLPNVGKSSFFNTLSKTGQYSLLPASPTLT